MFLDKLYRQHKIIRIYHFLYLFDSRVYIYNTISYFYTLNNFQNNKYMIRPFQTVLQDTLQHKFNLLSNNSYQYTINIYQNLNIINNYLCKVSKNHCLNMQKKDNQKCINFNLIGNHLSKMCIHFHYKYHKKLHTLNINFSLLLNRTLQNKKLSKHFTVQKIRYHKRNIYYFSKLDSFICHCMSYNYCL